MYNDLVENLFRWRFETYKCYEKLRPQGGTGCGGKCLTGVSFLTNIVVVKG